MPTKFSGEGQKNKKKNICKWILLAGIVLADCAVVCLAGFLRQIGASELLIGLLMSVIGSLVLWFYWLKLQQQERLSFNNCEHPLRFWIVFLICVICLEIFSFLPIPMQPILAVYVALTLFSNVSLGIVGGTILLMWYGYMNAVPLAVVFLYLVSGYFSSILFYRYNGKILLRNMTALCCAASIGSMSLILAYQKQLNWYPVIGTAFNLVLLSIVFLYFKQKILYRNAAVYSHLLAPDAELLSEFRERSKLDYLKGVHAVYFCEKIGVELGWNSEALKCAAQYYKWGSDLPELVKNYRFPQHSAKILLDYFKNEMSDIPQVKYKETAALVCTDIILTSMIYLLNGNNTLPGYDVIVDAIFDRMYKKGAFDRCEISGQEIYRIKEIFKEEKYYYDTLRRK